MCVCDLCVRVYLWLPVPRSGATPRGKNFPGTVLFLLISTHITLFRPTPDNFDFDVSCCGERAIKVAT